MASHIMHHLRCSSGSALAATSRALPVQSVRTLHSTTANAAAARYWRKSPALIQTSVRDGQHNITRSLQALTLTRTRSLSVRSHVDNRTTQQIADSTTLPSSTSTPSHPLAGTPSTEQLVTKRAAQQRPAERRSQQRLTREQEFPPVTNQQPLPPATGDLPPELGGKRQVLWKGVVVSAKSNKTINVEVDRYHLSTKYKRYFRFTKKFMTHDEHEEANEGDVVEVRQSRPLSKRKFYVLHQILHRRPQLDRDAEDPNAPRRRAIEASQLGEGSPKAISYP